MANKSRKIKNILIIYWFLLLYIISALVWWYVALSRQNEQMTTFKLQEINKSSQHYQKNVEMVMNENKRKTAQYIGEGSIFLLLISAGALFLFRAVKNQLKISQEQQNFMMAITHELKTPIAVTKLNLETLQKRKLDEEQQQRLIRNTLQEANRMNSLCDNLLLSSQMESQAYAITFEKINISNLISSCVKDFVDRFPERKIITEIETNLLMTGDLFLLQMAFNNLIENAIKYSSKEKAVMVKLYHHDQTFNIEVFDEGSGIPEQDKNKIFEKFYRTGTDATKHSKGTGLGLYLVKRIINSHQGSVTAENNHPKGTKFSVQLNSLL